MYLKLSNHFGNSRKIEEKKFFYINGFINRNRKFLRQ